MSENNTELNPFEQFETLGEILGFIYARHGGPTLRELLDMFGTEAPSGLSREALESGAAELESVGLLSAAAIVRQYAKDAYEAKYQCPYPPDDHPSVTYIGHGGRVFHSCNAKAWVAMERQKHPNYDVSKVVYAGPKPKG